MDYVTDIKLDGCKTELANLIYEKKLLQQLFDTYTSQYDQLTKQYPDTTTLTIHREHLQNEISHAQKKLGSVSWRIKKLQQAICGREKYIDFCKKFPLGRIPLGYDKESGNAIALPLRQLFSLSVSVLDSESRTLVLGNLFEAYCRENMQLIVFKRKNKSLFGEGSILTEKYAKRSKMIVFEPTPDDGSRLVKKLCKEMEQRSNLKRQYCKEHQIDSSDAGSALEAFEFIREKTTPIMVVLEEFTELEQILKPEDKAKLGALLAAKAGDEPQSAYDVMRRGRGYNLFYTGCFDLVFTSSEDKTDLLVDKFNPQHYVLTFASEEEPKRFARWSEYEYGIPGKPSCECMMDYNNSSYRFVMPCGADENPDDQNIFTLEL